MFMKNSTGAPGRIQKLPVEKIDAYIEIVVSTNRRLNTVGKNTQQSVFTVLSKYYTTVVITTVDNMTDLEMLVARKPDLVVPAMKFILLDPARGYNDSPKLWISGYLKENDIDFTGSDAEALTSEFDKPEAKQKAIDAGLHSSAYFISRINEPTLRYNLKFPLFVKPSSYGGSKGIDEKSVVYSQVELESKVTSIHNEYSSDALVEEYLVGREFSVAVIRRPDSDDLLAMPIEITTPVDTRGNSFLSAAVKNADSEKVLAVDTVELKDALNTLAIGVFKALGSRDYGRIDMRLDAFGVPNFIEANLMPGLSNHGYLSRCFYINRSIDYEEMILWIIKLGFKKTTQLPSKVLSSILPVSSEENTAALLAGAGVIAFE
jgi:D-alanine-D-alanine ligase